MPTALPYVPSYGKIKTLFEKIAAAKVPDSFTQTYLSETLGLSSSGDRPLIPLLRSLDLIDAAGRPSAAYPQLKNAQRAGAVLAHAIKHAYAPLFAANEKAHKLTMEELRGLVAQVAGSDDEVTKRTASTFRTLVEIAGAKAMESSEAAESAPAKEEKAEEKTTFVPKSDESANADKSSASPAKIRPEFHYNIQVHLPSNGTEETYLNIFNALRKALS
jgi:hypothetical protein